MRDAAGKLAIWYTVEHEVCVVNEYLFPYQTLLAKVLVVQMCVVVISRKCCMLSGVRDAITFML